MERKKRHSISSMFTHNCYRHFDFLPSQLKRRAENSPLVYLEPGLGATGFGAGLGTWCSEVEVCDGCGSLGSGLV